jgi:alginate O-acetyltransferase complex protein AlgI
MIAILIRFIVAIVFSIAVSRLADVNWRNRLWLLISLLFVGSFGILSVLFVVMISSLTFFVAKNIYIKNKQAMLYIGIAFNVLAIIASNYIQQINQGWCLLVPISNAVINSKIIIIGLSFYAIQHIAYLYDVYANKVTAEKVYINYLLASSFFPKIICGPIAYHPLLSNQFSQVIQFRTFFWLGFNRVLLGLFKKMVLADRLDLSVSSIFDYTDAYPGFTVLAGAILYTLQLYFDFSGYCDIAIGGARMIGLTLNENFDFPLRSTSMTLFWRRWHKSLILFLTNYVFNPIAFKYRQYGKKGVVLGIIATFLISAIWHGIGLAFLLWACCHIVYLLVELFLFNNRPVKHSLFMQFVRALIVLICLSISHLFFRSGCAAAGLIKLHQVLNIPLFLPSHWMPEFIAPLAVGGHQINIFNFSISILFIVFTLLFERRIFKWATGNYFNPYYFIVMLLLIFVFGIFNQGERFIYMQF